MVKFNDKRPESDKINKLFFVVFEWRDPFIQEIRLVSPSRRFVFTGSDLFILVYLIVTLGFALQIVTANPWNSVAILCGVFMALFKAADFAKLTVKWIIKMRKRHLRNKARELNQIS